jgi:hypothetical protein
MKRFTQLSILAIFLLVFTQCKKDDSQYNVYFSTSVSVTDSTWTLFVSGDNKGLLTNPTAEFNCSSPDSVLSKYIFLQLAAGNYQIEAKDESGSIKSSGTLKLSKDEVSGSGTEGGMQVQPADGCVVVKVFN